METLIPTAQQKLQLKMLDKIKQRDIEMLTTLQSSANLLTTAQECIHLDVSLTGVYTHRKAAETPTPYVDIDVTIDGRKLIMMVRQLQSRAYGLLDTDTMVAEMLSLQDVTRILTPRGLAMSTGRLNQHAHLRVENRAAKFPPLELPTVS